MKIATDKSQSQRLLACGVDSKTADMCFDSGALSLMKYHDALCERDCRRETYEIIPAWSLSALLTSVLPGILTVNKRDEVFTYTPKLRRDRNGQWALTYIAIHKAQDPIEACVKAIEWLTNNGFNLNTNQQ